VEEDERANQGASTGIANRGVERMASVPVSSPGAVGVTLPSGTVSESSQLTAGKPASSGSTEPSGSVTQLPQDASIALGVYTQDSPDPSEFDAFGQLVGRMPAIVMWYQSWSEPLFYYTQMSMVSQDGATPLITWDPVLSDGSGIPLSQIAAGIFDSYIVAQAEAAASWHTIIYVRFAHEMNLSSSPFGPSVNGNTPEIFVQAWQHVVSIFKEAGATNVRWVWSPNVNCEGQCPFQAFYPGDSWVDWVASTAITIPRWTTCRG